MVRQFREPFTLSSYYTQELPNPTLGNMGPKPAQRPHVLDTDSCLEMSRTGHRLPENSSEPPYTETDPQTAQVLVHGRAQRPENLDMNPQHSLYSLETIPNLEIPNISEITNCTQTPNSS